VEVFIARGELDRAEAEIRDNDETIKMSSASVFADASRFFGDVHLLRGELDKAEIAYRTAYEHGSNPHPGYALLLHRRGQSQAAIRALQRASNDGLDWSTMERRPLYLALAAVIAAESGDQDAAGQLIGELEKEPESWAVGTVRAHVLRARGEASLARGDGGQAVKLLRDALGVYQEMNAPLEAAGARLRLAKALLLVDDPEGAALELDSAEPVFRRNGARLYIDDCSKLRETLSTLQPSG
jgi:ATP/maltotriose-dependent transcriptional regulator MalT